MNNYISFVQLHSCEYSKMKEENKEILNSLGGEIAL